MAKESKQNDDKIVEKEQEVYVDEETIEINNENIKSSSELEKPKEIKSNSTIDAIIDEYNGEIKDYKKGENELKIRETDKMANIKKVNKKLIIVVSSVILVIIIAFVAISIINKTNNNIYKNVYIDNINVTGKNSSGLKELLEKQQEQLNTKTLKILQGREKILEVVPGDIDFEIDIAAMEKEVFGFGRNSNVFKNNIDILCAMIFKKEFDLVYKYDVSKLTDIVNEIKESLNDKVIQDSYVVDNKEYKLIITRGKSGNAIEEEKVKNSIITALSNSYGEYRVETITAKPAKLDVDVIYSKTKKEAKDAYIDKSGTVYKFVPHEVGLDFDKKDLQTVLDKEENNVEGKVIEYKLTVQEPKVKTSDIKWNVYEYKISSYTTTFSTSDPNRVNNLGVALNLLNGKVIMPGETFSYNSAVGAATAAQGFKAAATFVGGRVVKEVGGGICQTVSTLYNAALLANLQIVQRKAHSLPVAYVPESRDATVYYPSIDFKFKNTREYPIKIVTSFNRNGSLTIALYGTKEKNEYSISISSKRTSTIPCSVQYVNDSSLLKGKQVISQNGSNGYTSEAYITKKLNGKVVSTTLLSKDTYKSVSKIVRVGTKVVQSPSQQPNVNPTEPADQNQVNAGNSSNSTETTPNP